MIKLAISTFIGISLLVSACVIFFWRDTAYDPSSLDLIHYLLLIPALLTAIMLSPMLVMKVVKTYQEKNKIQMQLTLKEQQSSEEQTLAKKEELKSEQFCLNIYSAGAIHHFGENEQIVEGIKKFKSPELDRKLFNQYGLPILSYRITNLDNLFENLDEEEAPKLSVREKRIQYLIQQQLEQQSFSLTMIAEHLKKSALFYDTELAYEYRMHPRWTNPDAEDNFDVIDESIIETVPRLNCLFIHFILADNLVHKWTDSSSQSILNFVIDQFEILPQQLQVEHHFLSQENAYQEWMLLLKNTANSESDVHLWMSADSEIDQECLDEHLWMDEQYIPSEYASSWCTASLNTQIQGLEAKKVLKCTLNEMQLSEFMKLNQWNNLVQLQEDEPFLMVLDNVADVKTSKKLQQTFADTTIETYHFLFTKQNVGHTQNLSSVFGFMLGMYLPDDLIGMIYNSELDSSYAFLSKFDLDMAKTQNQIN